jgi:hypothetical protein
MKYYKIMCFKAEFAEFRTQVDNLIAEMSAGSHDEFALLMATDLQNNVGFHTTPHGDAALRTLVSRCYSVDLKNLSIKRPQTGAVVRMPRLLFRDNDGKFEWLVKEHEKYEADVKKYRVLSRHRSAAIPVISTLAGLLQDEDLWITGKSFYEVLDETCHYLIRRVVSGEHGRDAFVVFSSNLDFFFTELNAIVGNDAEIKFVNSTRELIFY